MRGELFQNASIGGPYSGVSLSASGGMGSYLEL